MASASVFEIHNIFFGHFDPDFVFYITKIGNFLGDLTDISAVKEAPVMARAATSWCTYLNSTVLTTLCTI